MLYAECGYISRQVAFTIDAAFFVFIQHLFWALASTPSNPEWVYARVTQQVPVVFFIQLHSVAKVGVDGGPLALQAPDIITL